MGRRKIEIKAIKDDRNRSVTFLKRKGGLFKKAHELAVLCSVDVAVIIFGNNKKLYEFSSCDMRETLARYQYCGAPHEHKGPEDFNGKRGDDDDDEDETTPAPEEVHATPPQNTHPMIPAHLGFQHVNHAPSASPPIGNGMPFDPRHGTPQPQGVSRPSSRNHLRRVSSNMGPQQHHATPPPPPPPQNGFGYMSNPSMYNPNVQQQHRPGQFAHYGHHPAGAHHHPPSHQHQHMQPHPLPTHTMPPQSMAQHHPVPPQHLQRHHQHVLTQQQPPMGMSQPPQVPQVTHTFVSDQGRSSMPPSYSAEQQQSQRTVSLPEGSTDQGPGHLKTEGSQSPPHQRSLSSKSRSIFTPIDDRGSVLARHFGVGPPSSPPSQLKAEAAQVGSESSKTAGQAVAQPPPRAATEAPRSQSVADIKPPTRTNSSQLPSKRPQLKVQIPSESSDRGSATADSSSRDSTGNKTLTPAKANPDGNHPGVVLPPPSPSAGAILSAGAQGPPNPFARPPPPEWGFGRSGPDSNMLPSPLTFPTPAAPSGPGFARDDDQDKDKKRKSPDGGSSAEGSSKKAKT
ncbi:hypothetical protein FE257_000501 [Aspergillus nanangensis]|uniref:MADS-box domain-containing protein n=1 Tax=Aspergillus nanangensis TaxID=2582783 RepID=A0AAD4CUE0_ASPNN|nr:hypothetical protein FE257_000501 [Aspergillus nanangensis]